MAISSTIKTPSQTTLANGSPTFIVYRRDLASIPTEQIELRAVAKITRTMKFDAKAKSPEYASEDLWSIRNLNYKLKVSLLREIPRCSSYVQTLFCPLDGMF